MGSKGVLEGNRMQERAPPREINLDRCQIFKVMS